jgi:hypothetical protein
MLKAEHSTCESPRPHRIDDEQRAILPGARWDDRFAPSRGITGVSTDLIHRRGVVGYQCGKPRRVLCTVYGTRRRGHIIETQRGMIGPLL